MFYHILPFRVSLCCSIPSIYVSFCCAPSVLICSLLSLIALFLVFVWSFAPWFSVFRTLNSLAYDLSMGKSQIDKHQIRHELFGTLPDLINFEKVFRNIFLINCQCINSNKKRSFHVRTKYITVFISPLTIHWFATR